MLQQALPKSGRATFGTLRSQDGARGAKAEDRAMIKEISIENFKSFGKIALSLRRCNILIGDNSSGKSNLIDAFRFQHDIERYGLENAISMQGGVDLLANSSIRKQQPLRIDLASESEEELEEITYDGLRFLFRPSSSLMAGGISIYDFPYKLSKGSCLFAGNAHLDEDGSNLAIAVKQIIKNEERKRMLLNLIGYLCPEIENANFCALDNFFSMSEGISHIIAFILAIYFSEDAIVIMEHPERSIYPASMSKMVSMLKDASVNKQIIITTHSSEIVRYMDKGNIALVKRDPSEFSNIQWLEENSDIQRFLDHGIRIEELFVDNLL